MKMNLLFLSAGLMALSIAAPASAADLGLRPYSKAPAMIGAVYDWSGLYIGINGGGASSRDCFSNTSGGGESLGCHNATGGTIGGQIGYRWQASNWVFGLEGQGNWADFSGSQSLIDATTGDQTLLRSKADSFALITAQLGHAWNNVLLYVKGGAAVVDNKFDMAAGATGVGPFLPGTAIWSGNDSRWGGTVGAGLEVGFAPNWSIGLEYNHMFLSGRDVSLAPTEIAIAHGAGVGTLRVKQDVDMGLVRLNYKFGGPVVARY